MITNLAQIASAAVRFRIGREHVDRHGFVTRDGERAVWRLVAELPPGVRVHLDLGAARHVSPRVLDLLADHLSSASELIFEGPDPAVTGAWLAAARGGQL